MQPGMVDCHAPPLSRPLEVTRWAGPRSSRQSSTGSEPHVRPSATRCVGSAWTRGLSIRAVARAAGIDAAHLSRIERGSAAPSQDALVAIATAMGYRTSIRLFPSDGPRIRDHVQVRMIEALLRDLRPRWVPRLEVAVYQPVRGVIDMVLHDRETHDVVAGEAHSVLTTFEHQLRWAGQKADSLPSAPRLAVGGHPRDAASRTPAPAALQSHDARPGSSGSPDIPGGLP